MDSQKKTKQKKNKKRERADAENYNTTRERIIFQQLNFPKLVTSACCVVLYNFYRA
jgi:hypothetical protein